MSCPYWDICVCLHASWRMVGKVSVRWCEVVLVYLLLHLCLCACECMRAVQAPHQAHDCQGAIVSSTRPLTCLVQFEPRPNTIQELSSDRFRMRMSLTFGAWLKCQRAAGMRKPHLLLLGALAAAGQDLERQLQLTSSSEAIGGLSFSTEGG